MRLELNAVAANPAASEAPAGEDRASGFALLLEADAQADVRTPPAHGAGAPAAPRVRGKGSVGDAEGDFPDIAPSQAAGAARLETTRHDDPAPPLAALVSIMGSEAGGLQPAEGLMDEPGAADPRQAPGPRPPAMLVPEAAAPMGDPAAAGPARPTLLFPPPAPARAGPERLAAAPPRDPSAGPVVPLPSGALVAPAPLLPADLAAAAVVAQRPVAPGRAASVERAASTAVAAAESALRTVGESFAAEPSPGPVPSQPSVAVILQAQQGPFRNSSDLPPASVPSAAPSAPVPETAPDAATVPVGPVQEIHLLAGAADGLGVVLQVASERDREEVAREAPALMSELAGVGAKVEAIRVELAGRLPQETPAGAAAGQSPGSGPGAGHPGKEESPARRSQGSEPAVRGVLAARPVDHGGKVDRYA